jgi:hypothetical protein
MLSAEIVAGALALAMCIRLCPAHAIRVELQYRLMSTRLLGSADSLQRRMASLVLGTPQMSQ